MRSIIEKMRLFLCLTIICMFPLVVYADETEKADLKAIIEPNTSAFFSLNFDAITFHGQAGKSLTGTATKNGESIGQASYTVNTNGNFSVYVSSTNLLSKEGKELTPERLSIIEESGTTPI